MTPIIPPNQIPLLRDALAIGIENTEELRERAIIASGGEENLHDGQCFEAELTTLRTAFDMLCLPD